MNPRVSIIVPAYNAEKYLDRTLESILCQTWSNLEVIVVDDASSDHTADIISSYAEKDSRIHVLHKKVNEGVSFARNDALALTTGEYLMFVDSDDWIDPETCEQAVRTIQQHRADVVMWSYIREGQNDSRPKQIFENDRFFDKTAVRNQLYRRMAGASAEELAHPENADALCTVWGKLYRRELVEQHHIRFSDIRKTGTYEDGLFNLEVFRYVERAFFLNQHFYHYRRGLSGSLSAIHQPDLPRKWKYMFQLIHQHLDRNNLGEDFYQALSNRIALSIIPLGINEMENPAGAAGAIRGLRALIRDPGYRSALRSLELRCLPLHWKVYFSCARMGWGRGLYLLLCVIQRIRGR